MSNEKISDLPSGSPAQPGDEIPIARGGSNFQILASDIANLASTLTVAGGIAASIGGNSAGFPQLVSNGTLVLAGGSNVTLSQNGNAVTINAAAGTANGGIAVVPGGNTSGTVATVSSGSLFLAGGNNVTLSQNGNSITISANTAAAANLSVSAGSTSGAFGGVTFGNANNVTFGLNNGTITATVPGQTNQTQAVGNIVGQGFSTQAQAGVVMVGTNNSNGLLLGVPPYITTYATQTNQTSPAGNIAGAGFTTTTQAGSVIAGTHNSNGLLLGVPGYLTAQSVQTQASGNIAGTGVTTTTQGGSTLGVTHNTAGLSLAIPAWLTTAATGGGGAATASVTVLGNSTQASNGTLALSAFNVSAAGIVSAGVSGNTLFISSPASTGITQSMYAASNTTQGSSGTQSIGSLVIAGAGNISVGVSNGSYVISGAGGGGGGVNFGVSNSGNTAGATGTVSTGNAILVGSGPITLSQIVGGAGSNATVIINAPAISSLNATGNASVSTNGSTIYVGANAAAVSISGNSTSAGAGYSNISSGTVVFAGGANITLSQNGSVISIVGGAGGGGGVAFAAGTQTQTSGTAVLSNSAGAGITFGMSNSSVITAAIATTAAYYFVGNTTGASSTSSAADQTLSVSMAGIVSGGWTNGSLVISATQAGQAFSASGGSSTFQTLNFANSNNVTFSNSNGSIIASVPPLSTLSGVSGISVSTAGSTIFVGEINVSKLNMWPTGAFSSAAIAPGSASVRYIQIPQNVSFSRVDVPAVFSLGSAATAATGNIEITSGCVIYSINGSTLSPIAGNFGTTTYSWASNSSGYSSLTGGKNVSFPIGTSLSGGEYWIGFQLSTNNNSSIGTATTQLPNTISMIYGLADTSNQYGDFGSTYGVSQNLSSQGILNGTITATNQTLAISNISATGTQGQAGNFPLIFRNY